MMVNKALYKKRKELGLCTKCGLELGNSPSSIRCISCYEKFKADKKRRTSQRKSNKLCLQCGSKKFQEICGTCSPNKALADFDRNLDQCKKCKKELDTTSISALCPECLKTVNYNHNNAIYCYGGECFSCGNTNIAELQLTSTDISKPMQYHGPELYKIICTSPNLPDNFSVLCNACYFKENIEHIKSYINPSEIVK